MNPRERVLTTLRHTEPDRIPIDLGSTGDTSIVSQPYAALRRHLGLPQRPVRVANVISQCAFVEDDVRQALGLDTAGVYYQPRRWQPATLRGGLAAEVPALWNPRMLEDGSEERLSADGIVTHRRPAECYYFEPAWSPLADAREPADLEPFRAVIAAYDRPAYLDMPFEELETVARLLNEATDLAVVGYFGGHILQAALQLRGWQAFLVDLVTGSPLAQALLDMITEANLRHFSRYAETVGKHVQVVIVEDDLGMQDRPLLSPALYRRMVKPYHQRLYSFIHEHCGAYLMLHSDGAIYPLIPDLIEIGVDILNPLQYTAKDMEAAKLKREFGDRLSFWGGGCDTQQVLPSGTPAQVRDEVRRRIEDLAPGGGFVFCQVHNVQPDVPPENLAAMYEAAREFGHY